MAYTSSTVNWDTIRALTHPHVAKKVSDNITSKIPTLHYLNQQGHKVTEQGGSEYLLPVFKETSSGEAYSGATVLSSTVGDPVTNAIYQRKQLQVPIMLTGTDMLKNSGGNPEAIVDYITLQVEVAQESMKEALGGSTLGIMSANGEADLGVTGLQNILPTSTTTGTCGGLSRATYSFWRHNSDSVATGFNTDGLASMAALFMSCTRGNETPNLFVTTQTAFGFLIRTLTGTVNYNQPVGATPDAGNFGFPTVYYLGTPCTFDQNIPANTGYMLNLKYLWLYVQADRDMAIRDFISPADQDALLGRIYWAGNLVASSLARQGLLTGTIDTY